MAVCWEASWREELSTGLDRGLALVHTISESSEEKFPPFSHGLLKFSYSLSTAASNRLSQTGLGPRKMALWGVSGRF